jgi:hypothetical protein
MSRFGPVLPTAVRRQIEKGEQFAREAGIANMPTAPAHMPRAVRWITTEPPNQRRAHRATGKDSGHPRFDDTGLAVAVRELVRVFNVTEPEAKRAVARSLMISVRDYRAVTEEAAIARVRRALARTPAHQSGAITNAGVRLR